MKDSPNTDLLFFLLGAAIIVGISVAVFYLLFMRFLALSLTQSLEVLGVVFALSMLLVTFINWMRRRGLPIAYNVAIAGLPQAGKTTLITSLFGEMFARRVLGVRASPSGESTIERVNADLAKLSSGEALGPTTDQDLFAYRTNVEVGSGLFRQVYKVEFGDFPGEDSREYGLEEYTRRQNEQFFKWTAEADVIVFVIDLGKYILDRYRFGDGRGHQRESTGNYVAHISAWARAVWQRYLESNVGGSRRPREQPVVLAFTKADLFATEKGSTEPGKIMQAIIELGFGSSTPPIKAINEELFRESKQFVEADFSDLINYLKGESRKFRVVYTSCFGLMNGKRLGLEELLKAVLPR